MPRADRRRELRGVEPRAEGLEAWLTLGLAAASFAALLFHHDQRLDLLAGGGRLGAFWWTAITAAYLPAALLAGGAARRAARLSGWPPLPPVLRIGAAAALFGTALAANRELLAEPGPLTSGRSLVALGAVALATIVAAAPAASRRRSRLAAIVLLVVTTAVALRARSPEPTATTPQAEARPTGERLLLIGIDGADPRYVEHLAAEGRLPNIARLREHGVSGNLATLVPTVSPPIWTTIATGRLPAEHGVLTHVVERPWLLAERMPQLPTGVAGLGVDALRRFLRARGLLVLSPISRQARRVPAYWNLATRYGQPVSVVGWWATWPAEPILGRIASDRLNYFRQRARGLGRIDSRRVTFPPDLADTLAGLLLPPEQVSYEQAREFLDVTAAEWAAEFDREWSHHDVRSEFRYYYSQFVTSAAIAERFARDDLAAGQAPMDQLVLFRIVDQTSHCCLRYSELTSGRGVDREEAASFRRVVSAAYEAVDREIGELLALFGTTNVVLVSDHGFESVRRAGGGRGFSHPDAPDGIFVASGPAFRRGAAEDLHVAQVLPILLYLKGLPVSDELAAPVRADLFTREFRAAHPIVRTASYGPYRHDVDLDEETAADRELLDELRALGYLD